MATSGLQVVQQLAQKRQNRRPAHPFYTEHQSYAIAPFMIAPVQPGETLTRLFLQCRAVSTPLKSAVQGSHLEYYFFYVKLSDLDGWATFQQMLMTPGTDVSAYQNAEGMGSGNAAFYTAYGAMDWPKLCYEQVVKKWFREEDEDFDNYVDAVAGYSIAKFQGPGWLSSMINSADADDELDDIDVDINADTTITVAEVQQAMSYWTYLQSKGLTEQTWADFLKTFGVNTRLAMQEEQLPELLRFTREWSYPANTIDPSDGSATTAASFVIRERADKDRFFSEHGFIIGVSVWRPKLYFSGATGAACGFLDDAYSWLPAALRYDQRTGIKTFAAGDGPLQSSTADYRMDLSDIFMYGDQWYYSPNVKGATIGLPTAAGERFYATDALRKLHSFSGTEVPYLKADGVVELTIKTRMQDLIPDMHSAV